MEERKSDAANSLFLPFLVQFLIVDVMNLGLLALQET